MLNNMVLVAAGAGFGVLARVLCSNWIKRKHHGAFPLATFIVNMFGALLLGVATGYGTGASFSLFIGTGFLGSFTTFSTFNVENIELLRRKKYRHLVGYLGGSYTFGIMLLFIGIMLGNGM